jgi:C4-dicarboxylate-binding protein DctP
MRWAWLWASLACGVAASGAGASGPVKLRATVPVPVTEPFTGAPLVAFKELVEKQTDGSVTVEIFDRGRPYPDETVIEAIRSGLLEMGVIGLNQFARRFTPAALMEQPFLFNFDGLVRAATSPDSEIRQRLDEAILKTMGLRVLAWQTIGTMVVYSMDGDVKDPNRIRGKRIRMFSETSARFVRQCGGIPVYETDGQVQKSLADGRLDLAMMTVAAIRSRELWKVTTAITRTDHVAFEFLVVIAEKAWQSLSDKHRSILAQAGQKVERDVRERASAIEASALELARSKGMKIYDLSPSEVTEWRACSAGLLVDYMERGGELSQALMRAYGKLRTDPCCSAGPRSGDETRMGTPRAP